MKFLPLGLVLMATAVPALRASELLSVQPLTDRIVLLHFKDGRVQYHQKGQSMSEDKVFTDPLDVTAAAQPASYRIESADDPAYKTRQLPLSVGRKSKGVEFAFIRDSWANNRVVNTQPDHVKEHWVYLELPAPMVPGKTYAIKTGDLAKNVRSLDLVYDLAKARSEAVHVNTLGYVPAAPEKFAYVYHWMGDKGSLVVVDADKRAFHLVDTQTGRRVFSGTLRFRKSKENPETFQTKDSPPYGNYLKADVWECDFSTFATPGTYVVSVDGIGCSWPFKLDADIYRQAFRPVTRALYHNRSGIALTQPYTEFERPAPHNPKLTPGFSGKLFYTASRFADWGSESGKPDVLKAAAKGPLDAWGWYQDAGDWDGYYTHLRVAQDLLLAYEMGPRKFRDGELNIPESGNGVPDILDEAAWLPRYCQRLRQELIAKGYGTGGVSLRVSGDGFGSDSKVLPDGTKVGQGSWEDVAREWAVAGEDPWSTYRYAGAAAQLAYALQLAGVKDPQGVDWSKEARESYAWAEKNTRAGDEDPKPIFAGSRINLAEPRSYAAAALFRLTGEAAYEQRFIADTRTITPSTVLGGDTAYGPWIYTLGGGKGVADAATLARIRSAALKTADEIVLTTASKRALRWGGNFGMPMLIGQQTTPWVLEGAVGYTLTKNSDPEKARRYLAGLYTTCDYFLGTNALNQTWMTGVGPRFPMHIFHLDAWYNGKGGRYQDGLIPYSPWRKGKDQGQGPWDQDWPNDTTYPAIDEWPGNERWFSNRCSPMGSEFTVHQNLGPAAAIFGFLCAEPAPSHSPQK
ncbi:MAG TPA: glycoside hydrolase family 9 protein [Rariglobus sp.]|nr:glycoside hydrolase family 9 protein [Rariglobus sp.]